MRKFTKSVRLPNHVSPQRYQIMLKPDLETFKFIGEETIFFTLTKSTKQITLHAKDLKIDSAEVVANHKGQKDIWAGKITYKPREETVTFTFPQTISKGKHQLKLSFSGILNDQLHGLYRSQYQHKGKTKHLAVSQFEATDARRAFPCFDEPAQKAIFDVTLMIPQHLAAVSNTVETDVQHHDNGFKVVKFAPTPKMSTYLLAFIIGEMEYIEGKTKDGVLVRIFTTPGKKHQAKFALEVGIKTLEFFNKYFDIPYPLPVLDMLAIPDFAAGAMENWGAVTYRETALLVDEQHTPLLNRQYVAHVIAHELTHQWFGNLVTMEWWTHLWLNEGFATYMSYLAVDKLFPQWHMWTQFIFQDMGVAMKLDALKTTHPIEVEVHHPSQIDEIFDAVSYNKGASVIRMLADYLGDKDFRDGLRHYLKKHSYKNTSTVHLWEAFEKISGKPVKRMMHIWTKQPGYPVVSVSDDGEKLHFQQQRFLSSESSRRKIRDKAVWPVPIKYQVYDRIPQYLMLNSKNASLELKGDQKSIKLNSGEVGFYSVKYEPALLQALHQLIRSQQLPQDDRMGIVRDTFALAQSGDSATLDALALAEQYQKENSFNVWVEVVTGLGEVDVLLAGNPKQAAFRQHVLRLLRDIKKQVNWQPKPEDSNNLTLLRSLTLGSLGYYGDKQVLKKAQQIFRQNYKNTSKIPPDIRGVVYQLVALQGRKRDYDRILELYRATDIHEEKNRLARALTLFNDPQMIKRTLAFAFSKEVRLQDGPFIFIFAWRNQKAWPYLWQYLQSHWQDLLKRYGQGGRMMGYMIKPLANFSEPKMVKAITNFLRKHPVPAASMTTAQTIEHLEAHLAWRRRDLKSLEIFLQ